jgi:hypothetical protein
MACQVKQDSHLTLILAILRIVATGPKASDPAPAPGMLCDKLSVGSPTCCSGGPGQRHFR